jgi:tRNA(fMet)-specific endonuclease VapC
MRGTRQPAVKYLLDSNTCIHYLRHGISSPVAVHLARQNPGDVVLCSVVIGELLFGAHRSHDVAKNLADVTGFCAGFLSLPFDDVAAQEYGAIRADLAAKGTPIGPNDLFIAAIALANRLTLVTHNTGEFSRVIGLALDDWQT